MLPFFNRKTESPGPGPAATRAEAIDVLCRESSQPDRLNKAWRMVRSAAGGPGIDQQTIEEFAADDRKFLQMISSTIHSGRYRFTRLRSAAIPKQDGDRRMLGIPTVKDRIVLQSIRLVLEPLFESRMHDACHAYRQGRGAETAMKAMAEGMAQGLCFVAETDIRKFFDSVRLKSLMKTIKHHSPQFAASPLLAAAMAVGPGRWPVKVGLAQGSPLSPLLANISLMEFDNADAATGVCLVRYADDLIMLAATRKNADRALKVAQQELGLIGLDLHPGKTRVIDSRTDEFEFLGFRFQPDRISPTAENWNRLQEEIQSLCAVEETMSWNDRVDRINALIRSFAWYYQSADCGRMLWNLDHYVRGHLTKLQETIGRPSQPWQDRLVTAHKLREARYSGKARKCRRWNGYG